MAFGDRLKAATPHSSMDLLEEKKKKCFKKALSLAPHLHPHFIICFLCALLESWFWST